MGRLCPCSLFGHALLMAAKIGLNAEIEIAYCHKEITFGHECNRMGGGGVKKAIPRRRRKCYYTSSFPGIACFRVGADLFVVHELLVFFGAYPEAFVEGAIERSIGAESYFIRHL